MTAIQLIAKNGLNTLHVAAAAIQEEAEEDHPF